MAVRGPYGTNEGDVWHARESAVGQRLYEEEGLTLVHEMLVKDGTLEECIYATKNPELVARAEAGYDEWVTAQAEMN